MLISGYKIRYVIAGSLFGVGLAMGFVPIFIASLLTRENLFLVCLDRMDGYWTMYRQQEKRVQSNIGEQ